MKNNAIRFLRISYWSGAILDALAALTMLFPDLFAFSGRLENFDPGADYRYAMGMGASLMIGWTALLLWADRKPMERKGILLVTLIPVFGLAVNEIIAVTDGFLSASALLPIWIVQALISALFVYSYWNARGNP